MVRLATRKDVPDILEIYKPYILTTTYTFEYVVPTLEEFARRYDHITESFPWLVWEEDGRILGYAYGERAFERAAYQWDAEAAIYLAMDARGRGIGGKLYDCLEELIRAMGYYNLYAVITSENTASMRFHERRGYENMMCLKRTGWKFQRWLDVYWYCLRLQQGDAPGEVPRAFARTDDMMI